MGGVLKVKVQITAVVTISPVRVHKYITEVTALWVLMACPGHSQTCQSLQAKTSLS